MPTYELRRAGSTGELLATVADIKELLEKMCDPSLLSFPVIVKSDDPVSYIVAQDGRVVETFAHLKTAVMFAASRGGDVFMSL